MILDNFIVARVIGLVDVAEPNAAFLLVSVLTTAPAISQDSSIALHRSPGTLPTRFAAEDSLPARVRVLKALAIGRHGPWRQDPALSRDLCQCRYGG
jgi:hypothetical protein